MGIAAFSATTFVASFGTSIPLTNTEDQGLFVHIGKKTSECPQGQAGIFPLTKAPGTPWAGDECGKDVLFPG